MGVTSEQLQSAIADLHTAADDGFRHLTDVSTIEEERAACAHNMALIRRSAAIDRLFLEYARAQTPDRSVGAIWRRAHRRSLEPNHAVQSRRWKARALGLDPAPLHNAIALSGMAPLQVDERWMLAIAFPQPAPLGDPHTHIEDVILIDPKTGRAHVLGDRGATHVGPPPGTVDRLTVTTDAKAWARQIALDRLEWYQLRKQRRAMMQAEPIWSGWPTSALLLAPPAKVRWADLSAPVLDVPLEMRRDVQRAIFAQARLPRIEGRA